jgi:HEAT repeat protein
MKTLLWFALAASFSSFVFAQAPAPMERAARVEYARLADRLNEIATVQSLKDQGAPAGALATVLVRDLADPDANVRAIAESTLVRIGPEAAPFVRPALESREPTVRAAAQRVLDRTHSSSPHLLAIR